MYLHDPARGDLQLKLPVTTVMRMRLSSLVLLLAASSDAFTGAVARPPQLGVPLRSPRAFTAPAHLPHMTAITHGGGLLALRGGLSASALVPRTPDAIFNMLFGGLASLCAIIVLLTRERRTGDAVAEVKPPAVAKLQRQFLIVFWLYKMADWLQGPYFYEVYASKVINGVQVTTQGVAQLFLIGFASTGLFGAIVGGLVDSFGRKRGSLFFSLMYTLSALSTKCAQLPLLFAGRFAGGVGTSLLFSAPEAWLVSEHQGKKFDGKYLGQTFGLAYFGDCNSRATRPLNA
jgi:MFS transporter, MFS domain-containing protein family, molybdate-anion transporter